MVKTTNRAADPDSEIGRPMVSSTQMTLPVDGLSTEEPRFLTEQLITCIGNKRSLVRPIQTAIWQVREQLGGRRLRVLDAFSGSGVVSRLLKSHAEQLTSNDIEDYATLISRCYLANHSEVSWRQIAELVSDLNARVELEPSLNGFIERLYAPRDDGHIQPGERVFYTRDNSRRLDFYCSQLNGLDEPLRTFLLGPLLSSASVHANTAGVFKGFYRDRTSGIGRFGGTGADALDRIKRRITLRQPILSRFECDTQVLQMDANALPSLDNDFDLVYLDPPYNQHPYGSNYFMLNLLVNYDEPKLISQVSGIPEGWRRSAYNTRRQAFSRFRELVCDISASFLLISYNDEGFIPVTEMRALLAEIGDVMECAIPYNTFRGSRNLWGRDVHVTEFLFLVKKGT